MEKEYIISDYENGKFIFSINMQGKIINIRHVWLDKQGKEKFSPIKSRKMNRDTTSYYFTYYGDKIRFDIGSF